MPELEIQTFADAHLDAAAALLAERHARHREAEPLLLETVDFRGEIAALWAREGASGAAALRDGKVVGYLLGTRLPPTPSRRRKTYGTSTPPQLRTGSKRAGQGTT
jgi:hypothetical protein